MTAKPESHHAKHPSDIPAPQASPAAGGGSESELERLRQEAAQAKDQYLRTLAEFENTKKRLHREKEEFIRYAAETLVRALLPVIDSLDQALVTVDPSTPPARFASSREMRSISGTEPRKSLRDFSGQSEAAGVARDSAPQVTGEREAGAVTGLRKQADIEAIIKGVHLIHRQLHGVLEKEGVKRIPTVGEPFDPHQHEAVAQVDASDGTPDDRIIEEVQVGYTLHGKVIRPAMVKVAKQRRPETEDHRPETGPSPHHQETTG